MIVILLKCLQDFLVAILKLFKLCVRYFKSCIERVQKINPHMKVFFKKLKPTNI